MNKLFLSISNERETNKRQKREREKERSKKMLKINSILLTFVIDDRRRLIHSLLFKVVNLFLPILAD